MQGERPSLRHVPALDGIRGAAVAGILLFHAGYLDGGWLGVDLFFVLSGFLITSLLLAEFDARGRVSLGTFWARRARRLLPALFVVLAGVAAYARVFASPNDLASIRAAGIATLLYVANWHAIYTVTDYWDLFSAGSPLEHTWSLAIEEQFYLLWPPLCIWLLHRFHGSARAVALAALAIAAASGLLMVLLFEESQGTARVYFGTDTRAAAVLLGAALAAGLHGRRPLVAASARILDVVGALAALVLAWGWATVHGDSAWVYRGGLFGFGVLSTCLIAAAVCAERGFVARLFSFAPLRWLGLVSYGLYLWHWPLYLVLSPERIGLDGVALAALRIAASLGFAAASYHFLELPIRRARSNALSRRALAVGGTAAFAVTTVLLVFTTSTSPAGLTPTDGPLVLPASTTGRRILVLGDSIAGGLGQLFDTLAGETALEIHTRSTAACSPMRASRIRFVKGTIIDGAVCDEAIDLWRNAHAEIKPDFVFLVDGLHGLWDRELDGVWRHPCEADYDRKLTSDTVAFLRSLPGSRPVLLLMPPKQQPSRHSRASPEAQRQLAKERMECQNAARLAAARELDAALIDLGEFVCPGESCGEKSARLRPDGTHYYPPEGLPAGVWLLEQLEVLASAPR